MSGMIPQKSKSDYNGVYQTYFGVQFKKPNIKIFHNMFMEKMAETWDYDLEKEILRQNDELTPTAEKRIDLSFEPLRKEIKTLYNVLRGLRKVMEDDYESSYSYREKVDEECKKSFSYWVNCFGWTSDPRIVSFGLPSKLPFIMTQAQEQAIATIDKCSKSRQDVLIEKSRAEGATELICMYKVWRWLYSPGFVGGFGSRVEKLVDKRGDPGTIFSRLRRIIHNLPKHMKPTGYTRKATGVLDKLLSLENPDMDSYLIGEGGDNIGRGNRYTIATVDEKAFTERPQLIDSSLSQSAECQIDLSTPNGQDEFYEKRISGKVKVITLWWWQNPSKNKNWREGKRPKKGDCSWYDFQVLTRDSVLVAREIDIDYMASVEGVMIPPEWVQSAIDLKLDKTGASVAGFDIAAAGKDKTMYISRKGPVCGMPQPIPFTSPSKSAWAAIELGKEDEISTLVYDRNTLGEDLHTILTEGERKVSVDLIGVYGQAKASDRLYDDEGLKGFEKFRNLRAEIWWCLRKRFEKTYMHVTNQAKYPHDELISIPGKSQALVNQLSSPMMVFTPNGKIGVESKKEMKSRNVSSPDEADALSYCYYPMNITNSVVPYFKNTNSQNYAYFEVDKRTPIDIYVSLYNTDDMKVYVNVCGLNNNNQKLLLLSERMYEFFDPLEIYRNAVDDSRGFEIKAWYGNKEIFKDLDKGRNVIWSQYRKAGIKLKTSYKDEFKSAISTLNSMFRDETLIVHDSCEKTMNHIRNWHHVNGKPQDNLYFAICLAQIINSLKKRRIFYTAKEESPIGYRNG